jgi:hypothetical protein
MSLSKTAEIQGFSQPCSGMLKRSKFSPEITHVTVILQRFIKHKHDKWMSILKSICKMEVKSSGFNGWTGFNYKLNKK